MYTYIMTINEIQDTSSFVTGCPYDRFDGVAVSNNAYAGIKCADDATRTSYLDKLNVIQNEAQKQTSGKLLTHFSISWHWGLCSDADSMIDWKGTHATATQHMIDIFDSVDIQVM